MRSSSSGDKTKRKSLEGEPERRVCRTKRREDMRAQEIREKRKERFDRPERQKEKREAKSQNREGDKETKPERGISVPTVALLYY